MAVKPVGGAGGIAEAAVLIAAIVLYQSSFVLVPPMQLLRFVTDRTDHRGLCSFC
jgi:hypothetical protein